jgi:hypothetical protein
LSFDVGGHPDALGMGDFNGDGSYDLAVANSSTDNVSILLGNGDGTFRTYGSVPVGSAPKAVGVGDFNGDGIPDLAVANANDGTVSVLLGNGDGSFQTGRTLAVGSDPVSLVVGDFNGDGLPDLAVANSGSNNVSILLNDGNWPSSPATGSRRLAASSSGLVPVVLGNPAPLAPPPALESPPARRLASLVSAPEPAAPTPAHEYAKDWMVAGNHKVPPHLAWTSWEIDKLAAELAAEL